MSETRQQMFERWARHASTSELVLFIARHADSCTDWDKQEREAYEQELDRRVPRPPLQPLT